MLCEIETCLHTSQYKNYMYCKHLPLLRTMMCFACCHLWDSLYFPYRSDTWINIPSRLKFRSMSIFTSALVSPEHTDLLTVACASAVFGQVFLEHGNRLLAAASGIAYSPYTISFLIKVHLIIFCLPSSAQVFP